MELFEITTFGGLSVTSDGQTISRFRSRSAALVLAYLALHPDRRITREELTEVVWPDSDPLKGRHSLRTALLSLRNQFELTETRLFLTDPESVQLIPSAFKCDATLFRNLVNSSAKATTESAAAIQLAEAVRMYKGTFLLGHYNDWVISLQLEFEDMLIEAATRLSEIEERRGAFRHALKAAKQALRVDPLRDDLIVRVQHLNTLVGEKGEFVEELEAHSKASDSGPTARTLGTVALLVTNARPLEFLADSRLKEYDFVSDGISEFVFDTATSAAEAALRLPETYAVAIDICEFEPEQRPRRQLESMLQVAASGQWLCTERAASFLKDTPSLQVLDLGRFFLKGSGKSHRIFQFDSVSEQTRSFPTLNTRRFIAGSVPIPVTRFFGRERDLSVIQEKLSGGAELITLLGPGGIGKTRLAVELLQLVSDKFPGGVFFVPLAGINTESELEISISKALGVPHSKAKCSVMELFSGLDVGKILVVLDNAEHMTANVVNVLSQVVHRGLPVQFVATSRERLDIPGEEVVSVLPLEYGGGPNPAPDSDCVQLFIDRAKMVMPDYRFSAQNIVQVSTICARLEGLPLAIELAAARIRSFPPEAMLKELDHKLDFLKSRSTFLPDRHKTMRSAVDWSYQMLSPEFQFAFRSLSVFSGTWSAKAAHSICGARPEDLDFLADVSLISHEQDDHDGRYRMLEVIRGFGEELLGGAERTEIESRFISFYCQLVEVASSHFSKRDETDAFEVLDHELANINKAIELAIGSDPAKALEICTHLPRYWEVRSFFRQGMEILNAAIVAARRKHLDCGAAVSSAGVFAAILGHYEEAMSLLEDARSQLVQSEDKKGLSDCLNRLGNICYLQGRFQDALKHYGDSFELARELCQNRERAILLHNMANVHADLDDPVTARRMHEAGVAIAIEIGDARMIALFRLAIAIIALHLRDYVDAKTLTSQSLETFIEIGDRHNIAKSNNTLGVLALVDREFENAKNLLSEALKLNRETGAAVPEATSLGRLALTNCLLGNFTEAKDDCVASCQLFLNLSLSTERAEAFLVLSVVLEGEESYERAARSLGFAEATATQVASALSPFGLIDVPALRQRLKTKLGPSEFTEARLFGENLLSAKVDDILVHLLGIS
ncbi:MAG: tetratricopeptide repeat protein [Fimbriimonadaceae bacterium]